MNKDEIIILNPEYDMEADAQREIANMKRNSNSASEASAKRKAKNKPVYKYEKLDHYAGIAILVLSGALILAAAIAIIYHWPIWWLGG